MKRRDALRAMSAATIAPFAVAAMTAASNQANAKAAATSAGKSNVEKIVLGDSFFLSKTNPIATVETRDLEALALELVKTPAIIKAKGAAARRWKIMAGSGLPAEAWEDFDAKMDEWTLHYLSLALNGDPNYPMVLGHGYGPPHEWFGMKFSGSRGPGTAENPDTNYGFVPIDGNARFELHGKRMNPATGYCPFHLVNNLSMGMNVASLDWRDVDINPDGTFVITISPEPLQTPKGKRRNHLQTTLDVRYLFIRDCRVDWRQIPNAFRIKRLDPPTAPPLTIEQKTALGARYIVNDISENFWFHRMVASVDANTVAPPETTTFFGGMPIQKLGRGRLNVEDDEAFVLTLGPGGAEYWIVVLYDYWLMSGDYWSRTSTLNNTQSVANADGTYSYVFSIQDPGVHNWVDTLGKHQPLFMIRWNLLPRTPGGIGGDPSARGELVKLKNLERVLPAGTQWVTPQERRQQLAERLNQFHLREVV